MYNQKKDITELWKPHLSIPAQTSPYPELSCNGSETGAALLS